MGAARSPVVLGSDRRPRRLRSNLRVCAKLCSHSCKSHPPRLQLLPVLDESRLLGLKVLLQKVNVEPPELERFQANRMEPYFSLSLRAWSILLTQIRKIMCTDITGKGKGNCLGRQRDLMSSGQGQGTVSTSLQHGGILCTLHGLLLSQT